MIQPIYVYGHPILEQKSTDILLNNPLLPTLIKNLWDTMRNAQGCGLSAPQIGIAYNVFVIDSKNAYQAIGKGFRKRFFEVGDVGIVETFINPQIQEISSNQWTTEEGCLSLPSVTKGVVRPWGIRVKYYDERLAYQEREFTGLTARMILHELDHTQGILLVNHFSLITRKLLYFKLKSIKKGRTKVSYPVFIR